MEKFKKGDFVRINDVLPSYQAHFCSGIYARVEYSSFSKEGFGNKDQYCLLLRTSQKYWSQASWYSADNLKLVTDNKIIERLKKETETKEDRMAIQDIEQLIIKLKTLKKDIQSKLKIV